MAALVSDRMKAVIDEAAEKFDWVIVDSPPVGLLPDASLIARWVNGVLLVIAARVTPYRAVQDALALLGPERVVGTVLNRAAQSGVAADYGHYYAPNSSPS
jgi:Mrp family chromosome partitioning ATPase